MMKSGTFENRFFAKVCTFEGFRSRAYLCPSGVLTIGYGHTANVKQTDKITPEEAYKLLQKDFTLYMTQLRSCNFELKENELFALTDLIFNIGFRAFKKSTLYKLCEGLSSARKDGLENLVENYLTVITHRILQFNKAHVNGELVILPGLQKRREFEVRVFSGLDF